jgi:DNA-binding XRE family transcriptional regulator
MPMIDRAIARVIGQNLRDARLAADWAQAKLAAHLGVTRLTIYNWETGAAPMPAWQLKRAARWLKKTPGWFFEEVHND